ncbi:hypothetical protein Plhal304r1_c056g0141601 [Plasmopara halstedii]
MSACCLKHQSLKAAHENRIASAVHLKKTFASMESVETGVSTARRIIVSLAHDQKTCLPIGERKKLRTM